jgi:cell fate regulator YaaT (PSP1 superfamily)
MPRYIVRYGSMRLMGEFSPTNDLKFSRATPVIIRTERGLEAGEILCLAPNQEAEPEVYEKGGNPAILRAMTTNDSRELERLHAQEREEFEVCLRSIEQLGLEMRLVDVEHLFGGERVIVYYLAEGRVDFRELVKLLAGEFQTRIEMRQIGVRDEAKLLADYGDCGKEVCCNMHLTEMPPVSMRMAKLQKATLDPSKISGRCGRLKCCLRYEYDMYEQMQKELPSLGARVDTPEGKARVIGHEVLASQVLVETDDHRRKLLPAASVTPTTDTAPPPERESGPENARREPSAGPRRGNGPRRSNPPKQP